MTRRALCPSGLAAPLARYSHAVEVEGARRLVFVSGQLAVAPDGSVPEGVEAQAELIFANVSKILAEAGMGMGDVVRVNAFVTAREHMAGYMRARDNAMRAGAVGGGPPPASTLVIVSGFTRPEFLVEVEVVAARGDLA
jgi:enamine deaminase RidA (YjgF/YER057c/UK114 family)